MSKYTHAERELVKCIVASLSIKRIPEPEIMEVYRQTNKTLSHSGLYRVKELIKKDSYKWYSKLRESEYEYIHQFKERINEIMDLQKRHYELIESNKHNPQIQQASLARITPIKHNTFKLL